MSACHAPRGARLCLALTHYHPALFQAQRFRVMGQALLSSVATVFHALGIRFWLSSGTLLGWSVSWTNLNLKKRGLATKLTSSFAERLHPRYRQCDFIPYSKDVDIAMFASDYDPGMLGPLLAAGLVLTHKFGTVEDGLELSLEDPGPYYRSDAKLHCLQMQALFCHRVVTLSRREKEYC